MILIPTRRPRRALAFVALLSSFAGLLATVWIVVPAPHYNVWLLSVVASEWSLWFGALGVAGAFLGVLARVRGANKLMCGAAVACGVLCFSFPLLPFFSARRAAGEHGVRLSLQQYIFGTSDGSSDSARGIGFTTHTYAEVEGTTLRLDAYLPPRGIAGNGAGVIVVHGGSWNAGVRNDFPRWNRWLAEQGYAVFDIDYRLAPQPNLRTATGDVKCAVRWVKRRAADFGIDPERVALLGRSAGGHLALLAAYTDGDARLESGCAADMADAGTSTLR